MPTWPVQAAAVLPTARAQVQTHASSAAIGPSQIWPSLVIDPHEFDWCLVDLDGGDDNALAGAVRLDDDVLPFESGF